MTSHSKRPRTKKPYDPRVSKRIGIAVIASLPIAVLLGVVVIKLSFMMLFAQLSVGYAASGDYKAALSVARWNLIGNVIEPWRAYYNTGTAELGLELYDDSRNSLSYALQSAPLPESCMVRTNLALAIEGQGDMANEIDEFEDAALFYDQAVAMLDNMPTECASESPSDSSSSDSDDESDSEEQEEEQEEEQDSPSTLGEQGEQSKERLDDKSEQAQSDQQEKEQKEKEEQEAAAAEAGEGAEGEQPAEETEAPGNTPLDDLGERMDEAEQDRTDWDSVDRSQNAPFTLPDKPW